MCHRIQQNQASLLRTQTRRSLRTHAYLPSRGWYWSRTAGTVRTRVSTTRCWRCSPASPGASRTSSPGRRCAAATAGSSSAWRDDAQRARRSVSTPGTCPSTWVAVTSATAAEIMPRTDVTRSDPKQTNRRARHAGPSNTYRPSRLDSSWILCRRNVTGLAPAARDPYVTMTSASVVNKTLTALFRSRRPVAPAGQLGRSAGELPSRAAWQPMNAVGRPPTATVSCTTAVRQCDRTCLGSQATRRPAH